MSEQNRRISLQKELYPNQEILYPPESFSWVRTRVERGPTLDEIRQYLQISDKKERLDKAPLFPIMIPIRERGDSQKEWPHYIGKHIRIIVPILITTFSFRENDGMYFIKGKLKMKSASTTRAILSVKLPKYSPIKRNSPIVIAAPTYSLIIEWWENGVFTLYT